MSQIITKLDSDDKRMKIDKFKLKNIVINTVWGDQFLYTSHKFDYKFGFWLLQCFSLDFSNPRSLSLIAFFLFYTTFLFHLHPPRTDQMVSVDTCPISIFLKSLCNSCKVENYCSGITSTLMRLES